jgi:hypothetical protein
MTFKARHSERSEESVSVAVTDLQLCLGMTERNGVILSGAKNL